jgi:hypothetical protein
LSNLLRLASFSLVPLPLPVASVSPTTFNSCKASQHRCSLLAGLTGGFGRNSPVAFVDG